MRIVLCRANEDAIITDVDNNYEVSSALVGGLIECIYPFDDNVVLVCNDEGKLNGMPFNRYLKHDNGVPYEAIMGDFFIVGDNLDGDFTDLTEAQAETYKKIFLHPDERTHEHLEEPRWSFISLSEEDFINWFTN